MSFQARIYAATSHARGVSLYYAPAASGASNQDAKILELNWKSLQCSPAGRSVSNAVNQSKNRKECAPPNTGVQIEEDYFDGRRMDELIQTRAKNQQAIKQQRNSYEEPNRNGFVRSHQPHQKIIFSTAKTIATTAAQNAGRSYSGTCA